MFASLQTWTIRQIDDRRRYVPDIQLAILRANGNHLEKRPSLVRREEESR